MQSLFANSALVDRTVLDYFDLFRLRATSDYYQLRRLVPDLLRGVSRVAYRRAYCCCESRQFDGPAGAPVMLPVADMFNHSPTGGVRWHFEPTRDAWVFRTTKVSGPTAPLALNDVCTQNFVVGDELMISYGAKRNVELLLVYGFVLDNPASENFYINVQYQDV